MNVIYIQMIMRIAMFMLIRVKFIHSSQKVNEHLLVFCQRNAGFSISLTINIDSSKILTYIQT